MGISRPREALNVLRVLFWTSWLWFLLGMAGLVIAFVFSYLGVVDPFSRSDGLALGIVLVLAVALGVTYTHTLGELYVKEERLEGILRLPPAGWRETRSRCPTTTACYWNRPTSGMSPTT